MTKVDKDEIKKVFRCPKCNLVPLVNYYLKESEDNDEAYVQKISIVCRNNHSEEDIDLDDFLESYIKEVKEENKKNDSLCITHNKKIKKICEKCNLNLCEECSHKCEKIIDIEEFALTEKEKNEIKENLKKFDPFFKHLEGLTRNCNEYQSFYETNKKLLNFAEIIFSTYLKNKEDNNLSFEIIRNCKYCLKFKYKELSLENDSTNVIRAQKLPLEIELFLKLAHSDGYESRKIKLYLAPKNYIILPTNDINKSNYKLLTDYKIEIKSIKDSYFTSCAELLDDKFAMVEKTNINIYENDSLDILYTIPIEVEIDENDYSWNEKVTSIFCLQNGNLIVSAYDGKIYIFKIKDDSYEKILEFEDESEHILGVIELKNKNILTFSKSKAIKIYNYNEKDKNYKLQYKSIIETEDEEIYTVKFEDSKDSETILLMTDKEMGIFNYKKGIYETKIVCQEPWYGYDVCFFRNNLYLEGNMNIYIKDRKTLEIKCFVELHESYQLDADLFYELKDGSFLCGMSNKYNNILRQYVYSNNNIIELSKLSFDGYKDHFKFIYQLKNGNIICSISNEEYFMLKYN